MVLWVSQVLALMDSLGLGFGEGVVEGLVIPAQEAERSLAKAGCLAERLGGGQELGASHRGQPGAVADIADIGVAKEDRAG